MSLLTTAQKYESGRTRPTSYTAVSLEEIELYLAYLEGNITFGQVRVALGRSYGYAANWCRRVTDWLFLQQKLRVVHNNVQVVYKTKDFAPQGFTRKVVA